MKVVGGTLLRGERGKYGTKTKGRTSVTEPTWANFPKPPDGDEWVHLKSVPQVMRALDVLGVSPNADPHQARVALELRGVYANRPLIIEAMNNRLRKNA